MDQPLDKGVAHATAGGPAQDSGRPRYVQRPVVSEGYSGQSVTHAHTSVLSDAKKEGGSLYSYVSARDIGQFIRELHGRTFNNLNETYFLPSDETEWIRLDKQHSALLIGFGGLYPCPEIVERVLSPQSNGEPRRILDVGCGTGSWAIEMAHRFPQSLVLGIDIAPIPLDASLYPPNLSFELDDINHGLTHYYNQFDLIQSRCIMAGISDMTRTLEELEACLKPGGILVVIDGDMLHEKERRDYVKMVRLEGDEEVSGVDEKGSVFSRMIWEASQASKILGSRLEASRVILDYGPWDHALVDPETIVIGSLFLPVGPWAEGSNVAETQMLKFTGTLMRQVLMNIHRALHSVLLSHGVEQQTLDEWSRRTDEEFNTMNPKMWARFRFFWVRRREGEGLPAPPLPALPTSDTAPTSNAAPSTTNAPPPTADGSQTAGSANIARYRYPAIETYPTRDATITRADERKASIGVVPQSVVEKAWLRIQNAQQGEGIASASQA